MKATNKIIIQKNVRCPCITILIAARNNGDDFFFLVYFFRLSDCDVPNFSYGGIACMDFPRYK